MNQPRATTAPVSGAVTPNPLEQCSRRLPLATGAALLVAASLGCGSPDAARPGRERDYGSPLSPEQARSRLQVDAGLRVELVAAEPQVRSPVAIAFDENAKLWVVEMPDYPTGPLQGRPAQGRIMVLEDRDSDGRYEHSTVFQDELLFATGIQPWRGGVFVTGQFGIHYLKDDDGDGRADRREALYEGSYTKVSQHFLNSPTLGFDGWIYVSNGLRTETVIPTAAPDQAVDVRGMDFRFDPIAGLHDAAAGMGQFGMSFDRWGRRFTVSNRNHVIHAVVPNRYLKRNPYLSPPATRDDQGAGGAARVFPLSSNWTTSIRHAGTFTAACGIAVYDSDLLPARYRGSAFTAEPTGNLVHQATLTPRGATFDVGRAHDGVEFLASPDRWFRPVFLADGPDGALYVVDMYQAEVEHPIYVPEDRRPRMDFRGGSELGRIWRIVPEAHRSGSGGADLGRASSAELAAVLESPNRWRRSTAHRLLLERQDASAIPALDRLARSSASPQARIHAAWLLERLVALERSHVEVLVTHSQPRVREHAVRLAERWLEDPELSARLLALVEDPDPRVRFQLALSLGELDHDRIVRPLARIARQSPEDRWTRVAVSSAAHGRTVALLATLFPADSGSWSDAAGLEDLLRELAAQVGAGDQPGDRSRAVALSLSWARPDALRWQLAALSGLADGLMRQGLSRRAALGRLRDTLPETEAGAFGEIVGRVEALVADPDGPLSERLDAVRLIGLVPWEESRAALLPLLAGEPPELAAEAVRTMADYAEPEASRALMNGWRAYLPALRRAVLAAVAERPDGAKLLLERLEARQLGPGELTPALIQKLRDDPALEERAREVLKAHSPQTLEEKLARYRPSLQDGGEVGAGREVFRKNCATCHRVGGIGANSGPDISDTRTKTRDALLEDILDPSRAIDAGYTSYTVVTGGGESMSGFIAARGGASITLRGQDGQDRTLSLQNVQELRSDGVSAMPEGLEAAITVDEMRDLIEFLKNWRFDGG